MQLVDGKYRLQEHVGDGAMGIVYRAEHVHLRRAVAVKVLAGPFSDAASLLRFRREAEALGRLHHPHVVEVLDFGIDPEQRPYLVMEYVEGTPLDVFIAREGTLRLDRALAILEAVAAGLDHAHAQGVLHRDLKPGNIIVGNDERGAGPVKVLDFGLARLLHGESATEDGPAPGARESEDRADLTQAGALVGTALYAAPEVIEGGRATPASDVYSFGVLAYELVVGRPPFQGTTAEVLAGHLEREAPDPAALGVSLPLGMDGTLREALCKDPAGRPPTAAHVVRELRHRQARAEAAALRRRDRPRRLTAAAAITGTLAVASPILWRLPVVESLERRSLDARYALRAVRADPRILLVSVDEPSLAASAQPLASQADSFAHVLDGLLRAGARAVAIDFVLPGGWSRSSAFSDVLLSHPDRLTLAAMAGPDGRIVGTDPVAGLTAGALGPDATSALFGLANIREDEDGPVRRARAGFRDTARSIRASWAARAAATVSGDSMVSDEVFLIDHAIDWREFSAVSWKEVPALLERQPALFRQRLVIVGGERVSTGDDAHRVPDVAGRGATVSGLVLQTLIVQTLLEGRPLRSSARALAVAIASLGGGIVALLLLLRPTPWLAAAALALGSIAWVAATAVLFRFQGTVAPVAGPVATGAMGLLLAVAAHARLGRAAGTET